LPKFNNNIQNSGTWKSLGEKIDFLRIFTELENCSTGKMPFTRVREDGWA
jgi:hypothetical protein